MEAIGDFFAPLTRNLYALRVPIAIASIVALVGLALLAYRRGWFAAARRHPGRTALAVIVSLLVAVPSGWYLGSPVFLRTSLVEPAPAESGAPALTPAGAAPSVAMPVPPASAQASSDASPGSTAEATPQPTPFAPASVAKGAFTGTDDFHFGRGTATVIEIEPGRYHLRLEDFSVRNGPDLFVYLSPEAAGFHEQALELGRLKATDGSFGYDLPEGTDPARFRSVIIWCKQFAHLFAAAPLEGV